jgi:hypothetical protein
MESCTKTSLSLRDTLGEPMSDSLVNYVLSTFVCSPLRGDSTRELIWRHINERGIEMILPIRDILNASSVTNGMCVS